MTLGDVVHALHFVDGIYIMEIARGISFDYNLLCTRPENLNCLFARSVRTLDYEA